MRRIAESLAVMLAVASLGAGAASGPSSLEAAGVTQQPVKTAGMHATNRKSSSPKPKAYQVGTASWYGEQFQGRPTASGEPYDMRDFTAAHPSLPLGSFVKVTNLRNGKAVVVRVNDRGPVVDGRIIDVSYNAAQALGFKDRGLQRVRLDVYPAGHRPKPQTEARLEPVANLN